MDTSLQIRPIPALRDNYIWLLRKGRQAVVVDPGEAAPVLDYLAEQALSLSAILVTHHHADHTGGIGALLQHHPCPVFAPARDGIAETSVPLQDGDEVSLSDLALTLQVLGVPGHTHGHVAYYGAGALFCGDTLFGCGCGRLFEGTFQEMYDSLTRLSALPADTQVYSAHEYTETGIHFALTIEPGNAALHQRALAIGKARQAGQPTVPFTLAEELATNPFLRTQAAEVIAAASEHADHPLVQPVEVFTVLRQWRDGY